MCHPPTISNSKTHIDHFESFPCVGSILDPHPKRQSWANKRQKAWEVNLSPKNGTCSHPYGGEQSQSHPVGCGGLGCTEANGVPRNVEPPRGRGVFCF